MATTYTTWGSVRGGCGHDHATREDADLCLELDMDGCGGQRGYSDRQVYESDPEGYYVGDDGEYAWPAGRSGAALRRVGMDERKGQS